MKAYALVFLFLLGCGSPDYLVTSETQELDTSTSVEGFVTIEMYAPGSHSQSERVFISTGSGQKYLLRKVGENAFQLPESRKLKGNKVSCTGSLYEAKLFIYDNCQVL